MRLLLEQRADVNLRDRIGATAIHRAGIGNNAEGIRMLVQAEWENVLWGGWTMVPRWWQLYVLVYLIAALSVS